MTRIKHRQYKIVTQSDHQCTTSQLTSLKPLFREQEHRESDSHLSRRSRRMRSSSTRTMWESRKDSNSWTRRYRQKKRKLSKSNEILKSWTRQSRRWKMKKRWRKRWTMEDHPSFRQKRSTSSNSKTQKRVSTSLVMCTWTTPKDRAQSRWQSLTMSIIS